ncbi:tRNA threonylcarbamoyl adenosine modification protein YeaZ [Microcella putealis]|uniref:tRNA threonylcarbamoyl adenosine modification protein YeaZ n=1 Tax=Microcella putealis TaxID=337005 RepID=A0A4Q7LP96_9MICO|nr:tRNA (adenosine(37)-N6)-threonylcarbamoyltransferase complex dimerization subunit type 1 TsaB [Microcella putealis]RZS56506.1 tRNA threonylcarbamoyl adenosine modification protein YeaZ [Microcella putealis]TQM27008.1 tRNA threonylcarbamoyl adenosine modification protein YeaZ [Microcella putealis]
MLLAIDTSAGTAVAAVAADGRVLSRRATPDTRRHAEVIGPFLDEVLAEATDAAPDEGLDGVVAGIGPGPFTGLRVGIAAARAVAIARSVPLLPVPSHDAVALELVEGGVAAGRFCVVTDARRREVAVTEYAAALPVPTVVVPARLELRVGFAPDAGVALYEVAEIPAVHLAHVAAARLAAGIAFPTPQPLYLRAPDVTMPTGAKRVTS